MAGHSASQTRVNALVSRPSRLSGHRARSIGTRGTSPRVTAVSGESLSTKLCALEAIFGGEIDDRGEYGADQDPQELIPVEERDADPGRLDPVVERRPQRGDELDDE